MSIQNVAPVTVLEQASESVGLPPMETESLVATEKEKVNHQDGSGTIGSQLLYGLGTLLFACPMVVPGIPMNWLAAGYIGVFGLAIIGATFWFGMRGIRSRTRRSRNQRFRS